MNGRRREWWRAALTAAILVAAAGLAVAVVVDAVRQRSFAPLWTVGWLPAVLIASLSGGSATACHPRRSRAGARGRARPGE